VVRIEMSKIENEKKDAASQRWLAAQKKSTYWAYKTHWARFQEFAGMSGDKILESRKGDKDFFWESKVLEFKTWLMAEKSLSSNSAMAATQAIRGFFGFHRMPLVFQRRETRKIGEHVRKTEDYRFSVEDLHRMDEVADLEEHYVVRAGKAFGLRAGDFLRLTRGNLEPYVGNEPPASIGTYNTQKEGVVAYPFIDSDAQPTIRLMLEKMTREGRTKQTDRILEFKKELQLSRVLRRLVQKAGINTGGKQVRFHCMRKFLCDHLSSFMSESKWKQIVGKKISEGAYVSPDTLREDYSRAMVETTFVREASNVPPEVEARIAVLEAEREQIRRQWKRRTGEPGLHEEEKKLKEEMRRIKQAMKKKDCSDGTHCQKICNETELGPLLETGWHVVTALPSGKIVIER
jgi:hypothetical protein